MKKLSDRSSRKRKDRLEKGKIDIKKLSDRSSKKRKDRHNKNFTTDPLEKGKTVYRNAQKSDLHSFWAPGFGSAFEMWIRIKILVLEIDNNLQQLAATSN